MAMFPFSMPSGSAHSEGREMAVRWLPPAGSQAQLGPSRQENKTIWLLPRPHSQREPQSFIQNKDHKGPMQAVPRRRCQEKAGGREC